MLDETAKRNNGGMSEHYLVEARLKDVFVCVDGETPGPRYSTLLMVTLANCHEFHQDECVENF